MPAIPDAPYEIIHRFPKPVRKLLTPEQVAEILNVSKKTVLDYAKHQKLKAFRVGRLVMFHPDEVNSFIEARTS